MNNVKKSFFASDGLCGSNTTLKVNQVQLNPKEIDFLNILTLNANEGIGKLFFETKNQITNKINFDAGELIITVCDNPNIDIEI